MTDECISLLRQRMIEDMSLRNFGEKTQKDYIRAVKNLTIFLQRSPDTASNEDLRLFQLRLAANRVASRPATPRSRRSGSTVATKSGRFSTSSLMRASNFTVPTMPTLRPKLRKVPRRSFSMAIAFDCNCLRWVSSMRSF